MPDLIGPYDSEPGWWTQAQWYQVARAWAPSGVLGTRQTALTSGGFAVTSSGLTVTVATGTAWIRGGGFAPDAPTPLTTTANAHGSWSRRDRVVIRRDLDAQTTTLELLTGTAAASPIPPDLAADDDGIWEEPICSFLVPPASGTTLAGFIDERAWVDPGGDGPRGVVARVTGTNTWAGNGTESRMTGSNNWSGVLRAGRRYEVVGRGDFDTDVAGNLAEMRIRGARNAVPTVANAVIAGDSTTVEGAPGRPQTYHAEGQFTVSATDTYQLSTFLRRLGGSGTVSIIPGMNGVHETYVRDLGPLVGTDTLPTL